MESLGLKTASAARQLQLLAVAALFLTLAFGGAFFSALGVYLLLFSGYRWLVLAYLAWVAYDRNSCYKGGRSNAWVRRWAWWRHVRDFFPLRLEARCRLDPARNYLLCVFPHGLLSTGAFVSFATEATGFADKFPGLACHLLTLTGHFFCPVTRELALCCGSGAASEKNIDYLLSYPGGGHATALVVGGASEAYYCYPGSYTVILKRRKGFVRLAVKNGVPLVPVISFGETDLYDQVPSPEGSWLRWLQDQVRAMFGIAPVIPMGAFGFIPFRKPVVTVVGKPMEVPKIPEPTREEVDEVHKKFTDHLIAFFEEEKHKYVSDPEKTFLKIV
ncbi:diacylglycerol O-acyltransferase 2-like [Bacillus rossius redtenbacheri]|uniref:diacylglycerol O-acyltransferase 2-like n=1 Tax=Bacillus rossius redtenbacheri TaxID=93214 RepID=UPI002FDD8B3F